MKLNNIFLINKNICTLNLSPGTKFYNESLIQVNKNEFRVWDPCKSKLGAAIKNGLKTFPLGYGENILYLGSAHGYTVSFLSDIVGKNGIIFAVDLAPEVLKKLVLLAEQRENIAPILANASNPEKYAKRITKVGFIFQDIASPNQAEILIRNSVFLNNDGVLYLAIKAKSISQAKSSEQVFKETKGLLKEHFKIIEEIYLEPYEKDHLFLVLKKNNIRHKK